MPRPPIDQRDRARPEVRRFLEECAAASKARRVVQVCIRGETVESVGAAANQLGAAAGHYLKMQLPQRVRNYYVAYGLLEVEVSE